MIFDAGRFLREEMVIDFQVKVKTQADDLVTNLDLAVQDFIVSRIKKRYPNDYLLAEEGDEKPCFDKGAVWILDPIDGTVNFITQKNQFAILLAYFEEGYGKFGLVYDVRADRLYSGGEAFLPQCNGEELNHFDGKSLSQSLVACNTGMILCDSHNIRKQLKKSLGIRNYGCAGISMVKVLENQLWGYFSYLYPWDYAAAAIIGEQLGYTLLTLDGEKPDYRTRQEIMFVPRVEAEQFINDMK